MPTYETIQKAKETREEWVPRIEAALRRFQAERWNPFSFGYLETQRFQTGDCESIESVGAFWFTRHNLLWMHVSVDGSFKVTMELPLYYDLGTEAGFEERLFARLEESMRGKFPTKL